MASKLESIVEGLRDSFNEARSVIYAVLPLLAQEAKRWLEENPIFQEDEMSERRVLILYLVAHGIKDRELIKLIVLWYEEQQMSAHATMQQVIQTTKD